MTIAGVPSSQVLLGYLITYCTPPVCENFGGCLAFLGGKGWGGGGGGA